MIRYLIQTVEIMISPLERFLQLSLLDQSRHLALLPLSAYVWWLTKKLADILVHYSRYHLSSHSK